MSRGLALSIDRVLMVSSLWPPALLGGAEIYAAALAERLRARGVAVGVVTLGVPGDDVVQVVKPWPYRLDSYASRGAFRRGLFHLADMFRPATARALRRAVRSFAPDVVHTHAVAGLSSVALAVPSGGAIGHVHTLHDYWLLCQRSTLVARDGTICEKRCRSCSAISAVRNRVVARHPPDVVLAVSRAVAAEHAKVPWMVGRVRVVPNPGERVDRPDGTQMTNREAAPVFGFLGRLTIEKGVDTLVEAFGMAHLPNGARLVIAGDGPCRDDYRDATRRAGRSGIEFTGWLDTAARERFFAEVDCLVVPSRWKDPAPLVVNEARARGIPVIGARIGGIPELVSPVCESLLFEPGDAAALAERLTRFVTSPEDFTHDDGEGLLDWDAHIDRVLVAYDDACGAREQV